jgi:SAM-dependent methyltransferase
LAWPPFRSGGEGCDALRFVTHPYTAGILPIHLVPFTAEARASSFEEVVCVTAIPTIDSLDEAAYLAANPDVAAAGMTASAHYLDWGQAEGRVQLCSIEDVAALRARKLARLRFCRAPATPALAGDPINFLSAEAICEFRILEAPPLLANRHGDILLDAIRANPDKLYLDIGAGLRFSVCSNVINTEIQATISTDVLCVGEDLPFADEQFDYVICGSVLARTRRPWDVAREITRVLKTGGTLLVDYPFLQGVQGHPHHYFNATPGAAVSLFEENFDIVESTIRSNNHPIHALWWMLRTWQRGLDTQESAHFESLTVGDILCIPPDQHNEKSYCCNLSETARNTIPAGSTLLATKRSPLPRTTESVLAEQLREMRNSTSWRMTAPLRLCMPAIGAWKRKGQQFFFEKKNQKTFASKRAGMLAFVICGVEHSGTTLLSEIFRQVPLLDSGFETGVLLSETPRQFRHEMPFAENIRGDWKITQEELEECCETDTFNVFYERLAARSQCIEPGCRTIFDKTPRYLATLTDCMEKVQVPFVVTYKDPRAIVFSDYTRAGCPDFDSWFATYADNKLGYLRGLHDQFNGIAGRSRRVLRMSLEEICLNPRTACKKLFAHCGQDFSLRYLLLQNLRYSGTRTASISPRTPFEYLLGFSEPQRARIARYFGELNAWFYD